MSVHLQINKYYSYKYSNLLLHTSHVCIFCIRYFIPFIFIFGFQSVCTSPRLLALQCFFTNLHVITDSRPIGAPAARQRCICGVAKTLQSRGSAAAATPASQSNIYLSNTAFPPQFTFAVWQCSANFQ